MIHMDSQMKVKMVTSDDNQTIDIIIEGDVEEITRFSKVSEQSDLTSGLSFCGKSIPDFKWPGIRRLNVMLHRAGAATDGEGNGLREGHSVMTHDSSKQVLYCIYVEHRLIHSDFR